MHQPTSPRRTLAAVAAASLLGAVLTALAPPASAGEVGPNDFRISQQAVPGGVSFSSLAYNPTADNYLVVWGGVEVDAAPEAKQVVYGQLVDARTGAEIGSDFVVARFGAAGDVQTDARTPAVAYNATLNEYAVAYVGATDTDPDVNLVTDFSEVYVQRVSSAGAAIGGGLRVSDMGADDANANFDVFQAPDLAWDATDNQYLVVWRADDDSNGLVNNENEVFGQRLAYSGGNLVETGANDVQLSDVGGANGASAFDASDPAVAWNSADDQYLVVWQADDTGTDNAFRIYGQLVTAAGAETGTNDFQISSLGSASDTTVEAFVPDVAYNPTAGNYLVTYENDGANGTAGTANDFEIFGQLLTSAGAASGGVVQLSQTGSPGASSHAQSPSIAYNVSDNHYLVSWVGDFSGDDQEIFGKRLDADLGTVENTFRVSDMGPDGVANAPLAPAAAFSERSVEGYLVTWSGENHGVLPAGESEVWGQLVAPVSDLQLTKSVNTSYPASGDAVTYTLTYTNAGPEKAYDVVLTDLVPAQLTGVSYVSTGATLSLRAGTTYIWDIAELAPGQGGTITITGTLATLPEGTVIGNTGSIGTTTIAKDPVPANNSQTANVTVDNPPALLSVDRTVSTPTNAASVSWTVTFDQSVDDVAASNFALSTTGLSGASITGVTGSGATRTVTADTGTGDGTVRLDMVNGAGITDTGIAGDKLLLTGNLPFAGETYTIDKTRPTATVALPGPDPTKVSPFNGTISFSEDVAGLELADLTVTNGTATNLAGSGSSYTVDVTPAGPGAVTLALPADLVTDLAGNGNDASNTASRMFDNVAPTVVMTSGTGDPTSISPISVTAQFSENVTGFTAGDVSVSGATLGNFVAVDGDTYTFNLTPAGQGTVTADIAAGAAVDAAGNDSLAAAPFSRVYDSVAPTIELSTGSTSPTNLAPIPVTATVSEDVASFDASKVSVTGGTAGNFAALDAHTYTFDVTPSGDGTVTVQVLAGAVSDGAGNASAASNTLSIEYDATAPIVTIDQAAGQADPTGASPIVFDVVFSEPVTGFGDADVTLGGTAGATTATVSGTGPSYTVSVSGMTANGTVIASIGAGAAVDGAGNPSAASTSTDNTVTFVENAAPTVAVAPIGTCFGSPVSGRVNLVITDPDGDPLTVTKSTSNAAVVPLSGIVLAPDKQSVTITPKLVKKGGVAVVTVTASDGSLSASTTIRVVVGTDRGDSITGTAGTDLVFGLNGNDSISTLGAIDVVCGGNGGGVIRGGEGADTLDGGNGDDDLRGEAGDDTLRGGSGTDLLTGGTGADSFSGGSGIDTFVDFNAGEGDTTDGS
ncbi:MAG TPA: Ig-like domain-containing protein [Nocardioides sp.]